MSNPLALCPSASEQGALGRQFQPAQEMSREFAKECSNCGKTEDLLLCSRCRCAYFCSASCQRAYWPFHKEWCRQNDFADAAEKTEPKFARWMRKHGKMAVLKDGARSSEPQSSTSIQSREITPTAPGRN